LGGYNNYVIKFNIKVLNYYIKFIIFNIHLDPPSALHAREADEVRANAEASALASSHADRGNDGVEESEHRRGDYSECSDLVEL
jgi:hypothetical protein